MGQTGKAPSNPTLSTSAHADHERDQGRVTPCYPDERCFLAWFGKSLWTFKNAFFGHVLTQPSCPKHAGVGPRQKKRVVLSYIWPEA